MAKRSKSRSGSRAIAVPAPPNEQESVSIRKIANGYLISKSGTRRGKYFTHEEYSAGRPVVTAAAPKPVAKRPAAARRRQSQSAGNEVGHLRGP
jgi:hypothetical protein